ncbi:hypothetical protein A3J44_07005 [candidate division WOR-1 bacterium RIFCSPHIGHO2_02_FULL_45_12]|nr:MAG: hypothetical protein A3J44_07005 [candidate division WOR-1 bacterium RIFCSPHIGHO2_02_FULL_45_12]
MANELRIPAGLIKQRALAANRPRIGLDYRRFGRAGGQHVTEMPEFTAAAQRVVQLHELLMAGTDELLKDGQLVMTGWKTESPFRPDAELEAIQAAGAVFAQSIDWFWSTGIGGSFLGNKATIEAVRGTLELFNLLLREERGDTPGILFFGQNMDASYVATALKIMEGKRIGGNVISKSGGTVEPAIAFAILKAAMESSMSPEEVAQRIVAITDAQKGALKQLAGQKGYKTYVVPDNVGGRYSVTCPVGLFSLAVAGIDLKKFIAGARRAEEDVRNQPFNTNIAMLRAVMRYVAHKHMGIKIEVASTGVYDLKSTTAWMQQLGPESEGKNGEGLWISPEYYTEMAHANGQAIQMAERTIMETFLMVDDPGVDVIIPGAGTPVAYLDGKGLNFANQAFIAGLRDAHYEGIVPTMSYVLPRLDAFTMGMLFQYEMNAIALSGLLLGQNPFIQPGVQAYKKIADARSGKPGTEQALAAMQKAEQQLNPNFII